MKRLYNYFIKYNTIIISFLIVVECSFLFLLYKSFNDRVETLDKTSVIKKEKYSMYIQDGNSYVAYTSTSTFPEGYVLNLTQSRCVDGNDQVVSNALTSANGKVTVTSNQTLYCTLYFDEDRHLVPYLIKLATLDNTLVTYTGKVTDDVSQIGTGVDATNVYRFSSSTKNNIVFANHCWQIRRTTETGGLKIQYNGEPILGTNNGETTYDCGTDRPRHMGYAKTSLDLSGTITYGDGYTTSVSGSTTTYTLTNTQSVQVTSSNASTIIPTLKDKYLCYTGTVTSCTNDGLKKIDTQSSGTYAYIYASTYRDSIGNSSFNNYTSPSDVGYMYNIKYPLSHITISENKGIVNASTYVIGDDIIDNGDGTFNLDGNVNEILGSNWSSNYTNYVNKYICMPGYWTNNGGTYTCGDNGAYNVGALRYITETATKNFTATKIYKYGYGIEAVGNTYQLISKPNTQNSLQYVTNWPDTSTSNCFANATTKINTCGYKTLSYSHYTCLNLTGSCDSYRYIANTLQSASIASTSITNGKYVSTDLTDTNNILYEMFNANNLNSIDSIIKDVIDYWYESNILNTNFEILLDYNAVYCNDRRITSFGGWDPDGGQIDENYEMLFTESTPSTSLECNRALDSFSTTNVLAQLSYPIGLMSNPEMAITNYFSRSSSSSYWTSSPARFELHNNSYMAAKARYVGNTGNLAYYIISSESNVRPAIVLNSSAEYSSGTGTTSDPFIVKGSEMTPSP